MKKWPRIALTGTLLLFLGFSCAVGLIRHDIKKDFNTWCAMAQAAHPHAGDDVDSLLAYVQSEAHTLQERNHAVWAIGQSRDSRALPVLEKYCTGRDCNHDRELCQYELEKAIRLCSKGAPNFSGLIKKHHQ